MNRFLLAILSKHEMCFVLGTLLLLALLFAGLFLNAVVNRDPDEGFLKAVVYAALLAHSLWRVRALGKVWARELWRFHQATRGFETMSGPHLMLRFDPVLRQRIDLPQVLQAWQQALDELTARFGFALKRTPIVYLFSTSAAVGRIHGPGKTVVALQGGDIVLATTSEGAAYHLSGEWPRHELAHLFAHSWNSTAPPFVQEGLASWLEATRDGTPMDFLALALLLAGDDYPLLCRLFHWPGDERSYTLVGSFTGFLIRRFGWQQYRAFYRQASVWSIVPAFERFWGRIETVFEQTFGLNVLDADRQWREDLRQRQAEFGPDLAVEVSERRAQEAFYRWRLHDCLAEYERLRSAGRANATVCWLASRSHGWLGNYAEAAAVLGESLARDKGWDRQEQADAWLALGRFHDLSGDRARAQDAYQQALGQPDSWNEPDGSTHAEAKRGLQEPFRESNYLERLKQWARSLPSE